MDGDDYLMLLKTLAVVLSVVVGSIGFVLYFVRVEFKLRGKPAAAVGDAAPGQSLRWLLPQFTRRPPRPRLLLCAELPLSY